MKNRENQFIRFLFTASMLLTVGLAVAAGFKSYNEPDTPFDMGWVYFIGILLFFTFTILEIAARQLKKNRKIEWLFSLAALNLFLIVEIILRMSGFDYRARIQFGFPRPVEISTYFQVDEDLFWILDSADPGINSLGFPGPEITNPKNENSFRILFLGDSVTTQGYPKMVVDVLNNKNINSGVQFENITLAVSGYSSHQGRVLADKYGDSLDADLAVVYFGWNDHWLAYNATDANKVVEVNESELGKISNFVYDNSRFMQSLAFSRDMFLGNNIPIDIVRVPLEDFEENLRQIQSVFVRQNIPVIFITAPTSRYSIPVPVDHLVVFYFAPDSETVIQLHKQYAQTLRQVVGGDGVYVLDLEAEMAAASDETLLTWFDGDGIHLTEVGLQKIAESIAGVIEENNLVTAP